MSVVFGQEANTFATIVSRGTGLDLRVVEAWMMAENSIHIRGSAPGHNWLNIGPGQTYASVQAAAQATVQLINTSSNYQGIRDSVQGSPAAQLAAIAASPWDGAHYGRNRLQPSGSLASDYREVGGSAILPGTGSGYGATQGGINQAVGGALSPFESLFTSGALWKRVGLVVAGIGFLGIGVIVVAKEVSPGVSVRA